VSAALERLPGEWRLILRQHRRVDEAVIGVVDALARHQAGGDLARAAALAREVEAALARCAAGIEGLVRNSCSG
jgi:hypothetical protein